MKELNCNNIVKLRGRLSTAYNNRWEKKINPLKSELIAEYVRYAKEQNIRYSSNKDIDWAFDVVVQDLNDWFDFKLLNLFQELGEREHVARGCKYYETNEEITKKYKHIKTGKLFCYIRSIYVHTCIFLTEWSYMSASCDRKCKYGISNSVKNNSVIEEIENSQELQLKLVWMYEVMQAAFCFTPDADYLQLLPDTIETLFPLCEKFKLNPFVAEKLKDSNTRFMQYRPLVRKWNSKSEDQDF